MLIQSHTQHANLMAFQNKNAGGSFSFAMIDDQIKNYIRITSSVPIFRFSFLAMKTCR